jgi:hypothetical protein
MTSVRKKTSSEIFRTPRWLRGPPRSLRSIINREEVSIYRRMRKAIVQELRPKTPIEWILVNEYVNSQFSAMRSGTWQAAVMQFSVGEGLRRAVKNRLRSGNKGSEADLALGLVASLNRPGANVTGSANLVSELSPKQLQLLRELIPNAVAFGVLADPAFPDTQSVIADLQAAARTLGRQLIVVNATTAGDLETAFATFSQQSVGAVLVSQSALWRMEQVAALAARHALPAIYPYREDALAGGLMSYGSSRGHAFHQVGIYTGRILKGEKPADLPVEQATKLELVINLKTAKALGLTIPETLLATADEVIQ